MSAKWRFDTELDFSKLNGLVPVVIQHAAGKSGDTGIRGPAHKELHFVEREQFVTPSRVLICIEEEFTVVRAAAIYDRNGRQKH